MAIDFGDIPDSEETKAKKPAGLIDFDSLPNASNTATATATIPQDNTANDGGVNIATSDVKTPYTAEQKANIIEAARKKGVADFETEYERTMKHRELANKEADIIAGMFHATNDPNIIRDAVAKLVPGSPFANYPDDSIKMTPEDIATIYKKLPESIKFFKNEVTPTKMAVGNVSNIMEPVVTMAEIAAFDAGLGLAGKGLVKTVGAIASGAGAAATRLGGESVINPSIPTIAKAGEKIFGGISDVATNLGKDVTKFKMFDRFRKFITPAVKSEETTIPATETVVTPAASTVPATEGTTEKVVLENGKVADQGVMPGMTRQEVGSVPTGKIPGGSKSAVDETMNALKEGQLSGAGQGNLLEKPAVESMAKTEAGVVAQTVPEKQYRGWKKVANDFIKEKPFEGLEPKTQADYNWIDTFNKRFTDEHLDSILKESKIEKGQIWKLASDLRKADIEQGSKTEYDTLLENLGNVLGRKKVTYTKAMPDGTLKNVTRDIMEKIDPGRWAETSTYKNMPAWKKLLYFSKGAPNTLDTVAESMMNNGVQLEGAGADSGAKLLDYIAGVGKKEKPILGDKNYYLRKAKEELANPKIVEELEKQSAPVVEKVAKPIKVEPNIAGQPVVNAENTEKTVAEGAVANTEKPLAETLTQPKEEGVQPVLKKEEIEKVMSDYRRFKSGEMPEGMPRKPDGTAFINDKYTGSINRLRLELSHDAESVFNRDALATVEDLLNADKTMPLNRLRQLADLNKYDPEKLFTGSDIEKNYTLLQMRDRLAQLSRNIAMLEKSGLDSTAPRMEMVSLLRKVDKAAFDRGQALSLMRGQVSTLPEMVRRNVMKDVIRAEQDNAKIVEVLKKVDWNNQRSVTEFYRTFVKPSWWEFWRTYRFVNMLSSPLTHIVNATSNSIQLGLSPLVKTVAAGADYLKYMGSMAGKTPAQREHYFSEFPLFVKGALGNIGEGFEQFFKAMAGTGNIGNVDLARLPMYKPSSIAGKAEFGYTAVLRALEAADKFFTTVFQGGEREALEYAKSMGAIKRFTYENGVLAPEELAKIKATIAMFRNDVFPEGQGIVANGIDHLTKLLYSARRNPMVDMLLPFVQTPMNVFKEGVNYTPLGYFNLFKGKDKAEIFAKASMGSALTAYTYYLALSGQATAKEKPDSGRPSYSIKIGKNWVSYNKLGVLAFPLAIGASIHDSLLHNPGDKLEAGKEMLSAFSVFLTNQSYMQQMANLVDALQGKSNAGRKIIASGVQQHIPYDAMLGWVERMMNKYEKSPIDFKQEVIKSLPIMEKWVMPKQDPNTLQYVKSTTSFRGGVKQGLMGALLPGKVVPFNRATDNEYKQKQKEQLLNAIIKNREMQRAYNEYLKRTRTQ